MTAVDRYVQSHVQRVIDGLISWFRRNFPNHSKLWIAGSATVFAAVPALLYASQTYGQRQHLVEPATSELFVSIPAVPPITSAAVAGNPVADDGASGTSSSVQVEQNNSSVSVTINGQSVSVPDNGSVQKTVPTADGNGQTSISISSHNSSTGQAGGGSQSSGSFRLNSTTTNTLNSEHTDD